MKKVLIVDDNEDILKVMRSLLECKGFDVTIMDRCSEVVDVVQNTRPDVVVMDISMGKSNGYEIYTELKQNLNTRRTPVLLMSSDDLDAALMLMHLRIEEVISKPFDLKGLIGKLKNLAA